MFCLDQELEMFQVKLFRIIYRLKTHCSPEPYETDQSKLKSDSFSVKIKTNFNKEKMLSWKIISDWVILSTTNQKHAYCIDSNSFMPHSKSNIT